MNPWYEVWELMLRSNHIYEWTHNIFPFSTDDPDLKASLRAKGKIFGISLFITPISINLGVPDYLPLCLARVEMEGDIVWIITCSLQVDVEPVWDACCKCHKSHMHPKFHICHKLYTCHKCKTYDTWALIAYDWVQHRLSSPMGWERWLLKLERFWLLNQMFFNAQQLHSKKGWFSGCSEIERPLDWLTRKWWCNVRNVMHKAYWVDQHGWE